MTYRTPTTDDSEHDCPTCGSQMQATFNVDKAGCSTQIAEPDCDYCEEEDLVKMIKQTEDGHSFFSGSFGPGWVSGEVKTNK